MAILPRPFSDVQMRALRKSAWSKRAFAHLDVIAEWPDDWDGQGAKKISKDIILRARQEIETTPDSKVPKKVHATPDSCISIEWFDGTETEIE